ncbi:MAG: metal ABC transporter permease [Spirochaetaceae bacterium]
MLETLLYPPVFRGLISLIIAGISFPLTGVFILRLNLINIRFMLMHGVMLAGAVALSFSYNPLLTAIIINIFLVLLITFMSRRSTIPMGTLTTFFMVLSIGIATILIYKSKVLVQDTMSLLWGSIFALTDYDVIFLLLFSLSTILFVILKHRELTAVLIDSEIAKTTGIKEQLYFYTIMIIIGLTVAFAMRLIGALLLDALILLPAMTAIFLAKSIKKMFITASVLGLLYSITGFFLSLIIDIPVSSGVILIAGLVFGITYITRYIHEKQI